MKKVFALIIIWCTCNMGISFGQKKDSILNVRSTRINHDSNNIIPTHEGYLSFSDRRISYLDKQYSSNWTKSFPELSKLIALDYSRVSNKALLLVADTEERVLIEIDLNNKSHEYHTIPLGKSNIINAVYGSNNKMIVLCDSSSIFKIYQCDSNGTLKLVNKLTSHSSSQNEQERFLLTLPDEKIMLVTNTDVWLMDSNGSVLWKCDNGEDKVVWNAARIISNNRVILVGGAIASAFNPNNIDARIMCIDTKLNKQLWVKPIGESKSEDIALDCIESIDGSLALLIKNNNDLRIGTINKKIEFSYQGLLPRSYQNQPIDSYSKFINKGNVLCVIGKIKDKEGIILQELSGIEKKTAVQQKINIPERDSKANLHAIIIGIEHPNVHYTTNDARSISVGVHKLKSSFFDTVHVEVLTTAAQTTKTKVSMALEQMVLNTLPKKNDLMLLYVSGISLTDSLSFRIVGSDFNQSTPISTSIDIKDIFTFLNQIDCKKLILLDMGNKCLEPKWNSMIPLNTDVIVASNGKKSIAFENDHLKHGLFTEALLRSLDEMISNEGKQLDIDVLFNLTKSKVVSLSSVLHKEEQRPFLFKKK